MIARERRHAPANPVPPARAHRGVVSFAVCTDALVWPDEVEMLVLNLRRQLLMQQREYVRRTAAIALQRKMLTKLVRRWFVCRNLPALVCPNTGELVWPNLLWPRSIAMSVLWPVLRTARPGSLVFGRRVLRRCEWQIIVVAAAQRNESCGLLW